MAEHVITLEHWTCRRYGERHSLLFDGRAIRTFSTELEARRFAREMGWEVRRATDV